MSLDRLGALTGVKPKVVDHDSDDIDSYHAHRLSATSASPPRSPARSSTTATTTATSTSSSSSSSSSPSFSSLSSSSSPSPPVAVPVEWQSFVAELQSVASQSKQITRTLDEAKFHATTQQRRRSVAGSLQSQLKQAATHAHAAKQILDEQKKPKKPNQQPSVYVPHYTHQLHTAIRDLHALASRVHTHLHSQQRHDLRLLLPTLTAAELDTVLDRNGGDSAGLIQRAVMGDAGAAAAMADTVQARHVDVLRLERSVAELYELFQQLAFLTDLQTEQMESINQHLENAAKETKKGDEELNEGEKYQDNARKTRTRICVAAAVVVAAVAAPTIAVKLS